MNCVLVGSRYFGAAVLAALQSESSATITRVVAPAADDRLAAAARAAGLDLAVLVDPKFVSGDDVPDGTDLILAAHTHARVGPEALARSRLGGIGYHPSLLPRHRGIAAVEWTVLSGDAIAGGSIYHLADGWDAGAIALQDWCFVQPGENARGLWERALAPMGLALLTRAVRHAAAHGSLPSMPQDPRYATRAPLLRRSVVLAEDAVAASTTALVVTVTGPDRPGIVSRIADCAERFGANWAASRLATAAGEFAGMVHFDVPNDSVDAFSTALRGLEAGDLRLLIATGVAGGVTATAAGLRGASLTLVGDDRVGIVSRLTRLLAEEGVGIEHLHTEIVPTRGRGVDAFRIAAHLMLPKGCRPNALQARLEVLAREMTLDIALGDRIHG